MRIVRGRSWRPAGHVTGVALALAVTAVACSAQTEAAGPFYTSTDVELLVPFNPGGGADETARFIAPFLADHLEGEPRVQVVNVPGGGSVIGANQFYLTQEGDGSGILFSSPSTHAAYVLGESAMEADFREMTPFLGLTEGGIAFARADTGLTSGSDLADFEDELIFGGTTPTGVEVMFLLALDMLDVDVDLVFGYEGRAAALLALEQGETTLDHQGTRNYIANVEPLVASGTVVPLFTYGVLEGGSVVRDPSFPDVPTFEEVYEDIHGEAPSGEIYESYLTLLASLNTFGKGLWMHKDVPDEAAAAVRAAVDDMLADETFHSVGSGILGAYEPLTGDALEAAAEEAFSYDEEQQRWLQDYLSSTYDVEFD